MQAPYSKGNFGYSLLELPQPINNDAPHPRLLEPSIRLADVADLTTIHRIEMVSYPDPWPRSIFYLMRGRAPDLFLVAEAEGDIVAYSVGEMEWRRGVRVGHVMNIAVAEAWRRMGIAGRLLDALECRFRERGAEFSYLEVRMCNEQAQHLYRKRGYQDLVVLPHYYKNEDGLIMEKPLD
jgi:ribosomal-protein-alanine N-acetyltransferase